MEVDHILRQILTLVVVDLVDHMLVQVMDKVMLPLDHIKMQMLTVDLVVEEEQQDQHPEMVVEVVPVLFSSPIQPEN